MWIGSATESLLSSRSWALLLAGQARINAAVAVTTKRVLNLDLTLVLLPFGRDC